MRGARPRQIPPECSTSKYSSRASTMAKDTQQEVTVLESTAPQVSSGTRQLARRVIRKIDRRILLLCFVTYNFNFMDKTVLSSAAVYGLRTDAVSLLVPGSCIL